MLRSDARAGRGRRGRNTLLAVALGAALVVAIAPAFMAKQARLLPVGTPADVGLRFEAVEFPPPDAALTLRGWWMPAAAPKAAVVMVHGGGDDNRALPHGNGLALARDLVARGYGVLAFDLRNYGESDASVDGRTHFGPVEANDVVGAVDFLRRRDPAIRVAALGFSMGGATAIYAAARDRRIEAVVTDSAFADSAEIAAAFVHASTGMPTWLLPAFLWSAATLHGVPVRDGRPVDVVGEIAPRRLLVVHDAHDPIVPLAHAKRLAAGCDGALLWITGETTAPAATPFGTHIQSYTRDPADYVARVTRFLDETFAPPAPS